MKASLLGQVARVFRFRGRRPDAMPSLSRQEMRDAISASDLFDEDFYRETYGADLVGPDLLGDFLGEGLARGHLPSRDFDPVLYRLTQPACGTSNPLLHYLLHGHGTRLRGLDEVFPDLVTGHARSGPGPLVDRKPGAAAVQRYLDSRDRVAAQETVDFSVDEDHFRLTVPSMNFFMERLRAEQPFVFGRLPHGYWDAMVTRDDIASDSRLASLPLPQRQAIAARIAAVALPHHGAFAEGLMEEMTRCIERNRGQSSFLNAIAFKGFFDADDGLFGPGKSEADRRVRLRLCRQFFSPGDVLYDATVWKRIAGSGRLDELPEACRTRHVVLVGPDYLADLDRRWGLSRFTHVSIPPSKSQEIRWSLLERVDMELAAASRVAGPRPVLLTMCGGSFAYWLFSHLYKRKQDVFYVDLGQAIMVWFPEADTRSPWLNLYLDARARRERQEVGGGTR